MWYVCIWVFLLLFCCLFLAHEILIILGLKIFWFRNFISRSIWLNLYSSTHTYSVCSFACCIYCTFVHAWYMLSVVSIVCNFLLHGFFKCQKRHRNSQLKSGLHNQRKKRKITKLGKHEFSFIYLVLLMRYLHLHCAFNIVTVSV